MRIQLRVISKCCLMYRIVQKQYSSSSHEYAYRLNLKHGDSFCFVVMKTKNINYPFNKHQLNKTKTMTACRWGFYEFVVGLLYAIQLKFGRINIHILFHFNNQAEIIESIQVSSTQTLYCIHHSK